MAFGACKALAMVRQAQSTDLPAIVRLYRQLHPDDPVVGDDDRAAVLAEILESSWLHLLVLEQEGQVVATTHLNVVPNLTRKASPYAVIENVVVEESLRGNGFGRQIMAETLRAACDAGCYKAMLMTGSTKSATHGFYRACGFLADAKAAYVARRPQ